MLAWAGGNPNRVWGFLELREAEAAGAGGLRGKSHTEKPTGTSLESQPHAIHACTEGTS